jgi:hypothetical protein
MAGKKNGSRKGLGMVAGALTIFAIVTVILLFYGGYLTGGTDASHMEGLDFSDYGWYLMIPILFVLVMVVVSIYLLTRITLKKKNQKAGMIVIGLISILTLMSSVIVGIYLGFYVRAYHDSANVADVTLQDNAGEGVAAIDLGNYTILSASVEEYHAKDQSIFDKLRLVTFDDKWRIVVRVNNTAEDQTGVTATLQGYALPKAGDTSYRTVTGLYAPSTQPGDSEVGDINTLVFEGMERDPRVIFFEMKILGEDGEVLGQAYIHPSAEFGEMAWFMDTAI